MAATLMRPCSSSPLSARRKTCFCSSLPMRATGAAASPEPPSASATPAQPHAISSEPTTAARAPRPAFFSFASPSVLSSASPIMRRASSIAVWVRPKERAFFMSSHGIDSSRS
jgi:hypothetical protein